MPILASSRYRSSSSAQYRKNPGTGTQSSSSRIASACSGLPSVYCAKRPIAPRNRDAAKGSITEAQQANASDQDVQGLQQRLDTADDVLWAGSGAVLGHAFPVWLGFRGGKAVATSYGVLIAAAWPVGLLAGALWLVMARLARISSLAALVSFLAAPVLAVVLANATIVKLALVIAVLVFARHHNNIRRLIAGTEPRIGQKA